MKVLNFVKVKPSLLTGIFQFPLPPPPTYPNLNKVVQCSQKFLIVNLVVNIHEKKLIRILTSYSIDFIDSVKANIFHQFELSSLHLTFYVVMRRSNSFRNPYFINQLPNFLRRWGSNSANQV